MNLSKRWAIICLFGFLLVQGSLFAQGNISGRVLDENAEPIIGANIELQGSTVGTITDLDGAFMLENIEEGKATVIISFIGYRESRRTVTVVSGETVDIAINLAPDSEVIDEVIVVGYGTKRKSEVTGTISKITNEEMRTVSTPSFEQTLQGQAAGLQVVQGSGLAGSASIVRIRGNSSLSSGGDPLYVVDGIPITQDYFLSENRGNQNNNPLATINPNDIESVEILKDASAAAIYGSRGANGVIIITTRRGKSGKPTFNFNSRVGFSRPSNMVEFLNAKELLQVQQEAYENDGFPSRYSDPTVPGRVKLPSALTNSNYAANNYTWEEVQDIDTDWFDEVIQTGFKQEYNMSMTQGNDFINSYFGVSYSNNETYHVGNSFERISGRANIDFKFSPKLKVGVSTSLSRGLNNRVDPLADGLGLAQSTALPIYPIFNKDGEYFNIYDNPVAKRELRDHQSLELRSINNLIIDYRPMENLSINLTGNYDYMDLGDYIHNSWDWYRVEILQGNGDPNDIYRQNQIGRSEKWKTMVNNFSTYGTITYNFDKILGGNHSLTVMAGSEYQEKQSKGEYWDYAGLEGQVFNSPVDTSNERVFLNQNVRYTIDEEKFFSVFSRLNYAYKDKYLVQLTYRRDGSSRFGNNKRFGNFPSVGLGYIVSKESFWNSSTINFFKLKASWGITGNAAIDWREQFGQYAFQREGELNSSLTYNGVPLRYVVKPQNNDLQWEVVTTIDAGFEFGLLDDRISGDLTYYQQLTTDALLGVALQASGGYENLRLFRNVAEVQNRGIEFSLTSRNIVSATKQGLSWTTTLNLGQNQNKVVEVGTATPDALGGGFGDTRAIPGEPMNTNYIIRWDGLDENGYPVYLTADGEPISQYREAFDRVVAGNGMPSVVGGLNNKFEYRQFDLSFLLVFSLGGELYDDAAKRQRGVVSIDNEGSWNMRKDILGNYWQQPGDGATYARLTLDPSNYGLNGIWNNNNTLWLEPASYARLRSISFGYTFPAENKSFRNLRVYLSANNLFTITEYSGWDPEVARERSNAQERNIGGTNITYLTPPQEKSFLFGLNLDF